MFDERISEMWKAMSLTASNRRTTESYLVEQYYGNRRSRLHLAIAGWSQSLGPGNSRSSLEEGAYLHSFA